MPRITRWCRRLHDRLTTPCYIFDTAEFADTIRRLSDTLGATADDFTVGYSVKTNPLPFAIAEAGRLGCMAEVVSGDEYTLARMNGFAPDRIIYNGPLKTHKTFVEAVTGGAVVNIETRRELSWLADMNCKGKDYPIGLRLNINLSQISPLDAAGDCDDSRFGFSESSGELARAIETIDSIEGVRLAGLHIHRSTYGRHPRYYRNAVSYVTDIIDRYGLRLDYLDVGGGFYAPAPNKPAFDDYVNAITEPLSARGLNHLRIIVEPGTSLTSNVFTLLTEVIDAKYADGGTRFVTTDGSRLDIDPFFRKSDFNHHIIPSSSTDRPTVPKQVVSGCTCLEQDRLLTLHDDVALQPGDRILYKNVGAYTLGLTPQFIRLWPAVYALDPDGTIRKVRRHSTAADLMP